MKITYAMNVLNGEPFIWYQLQSIYQHAYEIIIVEGAYKKFRHAANGFRSKDKTIEIIQQFPDPLNKIRLIARDYFYDDRVGMCNEFMPHISGDILWQIDVDEFYLTSTHHYVKQLFQFDDSLDQVSFNFLDYYKGFEHVVSGYVDSLTDVIRVNRVFPGMSWSSQRPPTLALNGQDLQPRKVINGREMLSKGHLMHNATMLFEDQVVDKFNYYARMWPREVMNFNYWYIWSWQNFNLKFCIAGMKKSLTYVVPTEYCLPESLKLLEADISSGKLKGYELNSRQVNYHLQQDCEYHIKVLAASSINQIESSSLLSLIPRCLRSIGYLLHLSSSIDKNFMISVLLRKTLIRPLKIIIKSMNFSSNSPL